VCACACVHVSVHQDMAVRVGLQEKREEIIQANGHALGAFCAHTNTHRYMYKTFKFQIKT